MDGVAAELVTPEVRQVVMIAIDRLDEPDWNPNDQSADVFGSLVTDMLEHGFLEPLVVAPVLGTDRFRVTRGNHRKRAAMVTGMTEVPCYVVDALSDEDEAKIDAIRGNALRGKLDPQKFTTLFNELRKKYDPELLRTRMGVVSESAFRQLYRDVRAQLPVDVRKKLDDTKREIADINDLARVLKELFATHGNDLDHSFMVFEYGHQTHLVVKMGPRTKANVERLVDDARSTGADINEVVCRLLEADLPLEEWLAARSSADVWIPLGMVLGTSDVPAAAAQVIREAIDTMEKAGDVNPTNRWQALEYLCAEYLAGAEPDQSLTPSQEAAANDSPEESDPHE